MDDSFDIKVTSVTDAIRNNPEPFIFFLVLLVVAVGTLIAYYKHQRRKLHLPQHSLVHSIKSTRSNLERNVKILLTTQTKTEGEYRPLTQGLPPRRDEVSTPDPSKKPDPGA